MILIVVLFHVRQEFDGKEKIAPIGQLEGKFRLANLTNHFIVMIRILLAQIMIRFLLDSFATNRDWPV